MGRSTEGEQEDIYKRKNEEKRERCWEEEEQEEEEEEVKGASSRGTPAEQFCTQERAPRPKRGTPVVIIRGPSECFWPR